MIILPATDLGPLGRAWTRKGVEGEGGGAPSALVGVP